MKLLISGILMMILLNSCRVFLGDLTMISTRNVDPNAKYIELKRYANGKSRRFETGIESAVNDAVKSAYGGEFMKNVSIYKRGKKILVEGDVWGLIVEQTYGRSNIGLNMGDTVYWKSFGGTLLNGVVIKLGEEYVIVERVTPTGIKAAKKVRRDKLYKKDE